MRLPLLIARQWLDRITHPVPPEIVPAANPPVYVQYKHGWSGRKEPRRKHDVVYLCFHQTAVVFGLSDRQIKAAGGDRKKALHKRFEGTPYHDIGLNCGDVLLNNNPERYTYHAGKLNRDSMGVCVEARLPHLEKDYDPRKHSEWGQVQIQAAREAARQAYREAFAWGAVIQGIVCHRQSSLAKPNDPGEQIFRDVIVPVALELRLPILTTFTRGGRPLPPEWTRHCNGKDH